jgi:hypothetical protein
VGLHAQRDGEHIIIGYTSATAEISIRGHVDEVRHFWGELGAVVDQADQAEAADTDAALAEGLDDGTIEGGM